MSSRVRLEMLRTLASGHPMTYRDIEDATGFPPPTIRKALTRLEELGYVTVSAPPNRRHGRTVTYTLDTNHVRAGYAALGEYLLHSR